MNAGRRTILKVLPMAASAGIAIARGQSGEPANSTVELAFGAPQEGAVRPLEIVGLRTPAGEATNKTLVVQDGAGREYVRMPAAAEMSFAVGGALGRQTARLLGPDGRSAAEVAFNVDCATQVRDEGGVFQGLVEAVLWSMMSWNQNCPVSAIPLNGRVYQFFANWIFDHTLILKGMKYYWPSVKDTIDFFADTQREDGMIWENCYPATPGPDYFDWKFHYGGFVKRFGNGFWQLRRAPVESHVEQYFVEGLYATWKATGDLDWMKGKLDNAMRALRQVQHSTYRWSQKYQLMHRGFTIDTWDYTSDDQQRFDQCVFTVFPGKSEFGVFHGDNTNLVAQCRHLAEMLREAGRASDAPEFEQLANGVELRLNALSWNGEFYTHWIAENPDYKPDVGVDMSRQVSLSNAYALNRGVAHERCVGILKTYQRIRAEMPASSPGEFYGIYPPFEKDFTRNDPGMMWEYCNGGVLTVVGGELAHGAFKHGFEEYGADILRRLRGIADRYSGYLPVTLRGKAVEAPMRAFEPVNIEAAFNAALGTGSQEAPSWSGDPQQNLEGIPTGEQTFQGVRFNVPGAAPNGTPDCIVISRHSPYRDRATVPVNAKAVSIYLLNTSNKPGTAGQSLTFHYSDGSAQTVDVEGHGWFNPADTRYSKDGPRTRDTYRVAWSKTTEDEVTLGIYATGLANPRPERRIASLEFAAASEQCKWMIAAVSLCDASVFFAPYDDLSTGIPDGWAGSVTQAVIEGLGGVNDEGAAFSKTAIRPRWTAAQIAEAEITARYPASQGYCSYRYSAGEDMVMLEFTGSAEKFHVEALIPRGKRVASAQLDAKPIRVEFKTIEESVYAVVAPVSHGVHRLEIELA
ncbi:MAG: hypothetical protein WBE41_13140 [Terracidiphilus sp.]